MNRLNLLLLVLVVASALGVVTVQNQSRQYFAKINVAKNQQQKLNEELNRLNAKRASFLQPDLIRRSVKRHQLHPPEVAETVVVSPQTIR